MENHHVQWVNPLFLWPFSLAMPNYQRVPFETEVSVIHFFHICRPDSAFDSRSLAHFSGSTSRQQSANVLRSQSARLRSKFRPFMKAAFAKPCYRRLSAAGLGQELGEKQQKSEKKSGWWLKDNLWIILMGNLWLTYG